MSVAGLTAKVSVKTRIYAGFLIVLSLLILVGLISVKGLNSAVSTFDQYANTANDSVRVLMIERDVANLRRNVLAYATTGDKAVMDNVRSSIKGLNSLLTDALKEADDPKVADQIKLAAGHLQAYEQSLIQLQTARQKRDESVNARLAPLGNKAVAQLADIVAEAMARQDYKNAAQIGQMQQSLLTTRIAMYRFLQSYDPKLAADSTEAMASLAKQIATHADRDGEESKAKEQDAAATLTQYSQSIADLATAIGEIDHLVGKVLPAQADQFAKAASDTRELQSRSLTEMMQSADKRLQGTSTGTTVLVVGAILLGLIFATVISRSIVNPVRRMTETMTILASGDKTVTVPALDNHDEIGEMARAVQVFKENAIRIERLQHEQEEMKLRAAQERRNAMLKLADDFESGVKGIVNSVSASATQMQSTAGSMSAMATQASRQATAVAAASEQAAANVETVASAAEELSSSIHEIARQVAEAAQVAGDAVAVADRTDTVMRTLDQSTGRIGEVVSLINDIASQTNLLALNATIEAARAGEAGKGFAVVAGEVKTLANQTAKATDEISNQIGSVQSSAREAVEAISQINGIIARISEISSAIASAVEEQGAATQEIARNVEQAAQGTQDVSANIGGVNEAAGEAGSAATEVLSVAEELARQSNLLSSEVDTFIATVRAG